MPLQGLFSIERLAVERSGLERALLAGAAPPWVLSAPRSCSTKPVRPRRPTTRRAPTRRPGSPRSRDMSRSLTSRGCLPTGRSFRFDVAHFTTLHANRGAQIYRGLLAAWPGRGPADGLRSIAAGVVRQLQGAVRARRRRARPSLARAAILLLITPRDGEVRARGARGDRGLRSARSADGPRAVGQPRSPVRWATRRLGRGHVTVGDHVRVLALWLREARASWADGGWRATARPAAWRQRRSPGSASTTWIWPCARRDRRGLWAAQGAALADSLVSHVGRHRGHHEGPGRRRPGPRGPRRPIDIEEHLAINADFLFCKSTWERGDLRPPVPGHGPRLVDGCLLSLPDEYPLEPLALPEPFVLLLGTTRRWNESEAAFRQVCEPRAGGIGPRAACGLPRPPRPCRRARARGWLSWPMALVR